MTTFDLPHVSAACAAAFLAGAVNSVAGGGTLISFPTLIWLGLPSITANATSTVAIWPGSLGSLWGFRRELGQTQPLMRYLAVPSMIGGAIGAFLLRLTSAATFDNLVPFLILFATVLFAIQGPVRKHLMRNTRKTIAAHMESRTTPPTGCALGTPPEDPTRSFAAGPRASAPFALVTPSHDHSHRSPRWVIGAMFFQLLVGIYGGYFGAGISIMMLSTLSILGMTDILQMNALTSMFSLCINGVAAALFISAKMVYWPYVLAMAIAAIIGGYGAAGVARRVGRTAVRRFVIVVGFSISILLLIKRL